MDPEDSSAHSSADGWQDWEEESAADDLVERAERGALCIHELDLAVYRGATDALDVQRTVSREEVRTFLLCRVRAPRGSAFGRVPDAVCRLIVAIAGGLFVAADAFKGRREGMVFKLGGRGLGYYPDYNALEQAARYRELTVGERLDAIETQLHTDTSWSGDAQGYDMPQLTAREWEVVISRLRELDSMDISRSELNGTRIYTHVAFLSHLAREGNAAVEVARALVQKWDTQAGDQIVHPWM